MFRAIRVTCVSLVMKKKAGIDNEQIVQRKFICLISHKIHSCVFGRMSSRGTVDVLKTESPSMSSCKTRLTSSS